MAQSFEWYRERNATTAKALRTEALESLCGRGLIVRRPGIGAEREDLDVRHVGLPLGMKAQCIDRRGL